MNEQINTQTGTVSGSGEQQCHYQIGFLLLSDATFGRGDGLAGSVDQEVEHDSLGLPFLRGRTLKGLLNEECANILYTLEQSYGGKDSPKYRKWAASAQRLFGSPGSGIKSQGWVRYGNATLPDSIRAAVEYALDPENRQREKSPLVASNFLESLTTIRRQTALDEQGVPLQTSLRAMRVILRQTPFAAEMICNHNPKQQGDLLQQDLALLAASIKGWRRAGTGRNRGRGHLQASLLDSNGENVTEDYFSTFRDDLVAQSQTQSVQGGHHS